jgi:hypothetical protein
MDRRSFLKSLGTIGIALPVVSLPQHIFKPDVIKRIDLDQRVTFRRFKDGRWNLEFISDELLKVDYKDELVIEIDEEYILSDIQEIQVSTEYLFRWSKGRQDRDYIHWLTGNKWVQI